MESRFSLRQWTSVRFEYTLCRSGSATQICSTTPRENAAAAERLERIAKAFGGDAEVDGSGRVLLPASLREAMGLEKQAVMVDVHKGRLNVVSKKIHDEQLQVSQSQPGRGSGGA